MRTAIWYPLVLLFGSAFIIQATIAGIAKLPGKIQPWIVWGGGVLAGLAMLASGVFATKTWINTRMLHWILSWHPVVGLILAVIFMWLVWKVTMAALPDDVMTITASTGLIVALFLLPSMALQLRLPGDVGRLSRDAVEAASGVAIDVTGGWFAD